MVAESDALAVREPQQRRSREAWVRILDAGVAVLQEGGVGAFTIAAVCERAGVPPRAVYDRVDSKDALFLAVYEHGMAVVRQGHAVFEDEELWVGLSPKEAVETAVGHLLDLFADNAAFLRSVVLVSGVKPEVYRRGALYVAELEEHVVGRIAAATGDALGLRERARVAFVVAFSTVTLGTAYGPDFFENLAEGEQLRAALPEMIAGYLGV